MSQTSNQTGTATPSQQSLPGLDTVIPVVRAHSTVLGDWGDAVVDRVAGSLVVLYAFDHGDRCRVVTRRDLGALGVDQVSLAAAALENLIDRMGDLQILERPDGCGMVRIDGTLEASALLVTQLRHRRDTVRRRDRRRSDP